VYHGFATCGDICRGSMKEFIGVFFVVLEVQTAMVAEFYGVIHAMEEAQKMKLTNVWLECDSALICVTFTMTNVSWMFRNRWNTYLNYGRKTRFMVTHIFLKEMFGLINNVFIFLLLSLLLLLSSSSLLSLLT